MASSRHEWVIDRKVDRTYPPNMPQGLKRYHQTGKLHFVTFSCYHRLPFLAGDHPKQIFERILEQTRVSHGVEIHAYVLMPEHVHLLLSEPTETDLATTLKVLKQQTSKLLKGTREHFWQARYYDFNIHTEKKSFEKLRYIHRNPVTRGLSLTPEAYPWSSAHHYATGLPQTVRIHSFWTTRTASQATVPDQARGPGPDAATTRVPHLRDSLIVAKVGLRATRESHSPRAPTLGG